MRVTFHQNDIRLASTRLRCVIPAKQLKARGVEICADGDVLIWGKHFLDLETVSKFKTKVFDVCDDHFDGHLSGYYRQALRLADVVTCNSDSMRFRLHQLGRIATVIPDPYETERKDPSWGEGLLWFGHESNLPDLRRLKLEVKVLTGTDWSYEAQEKALSECAIVVIPTGKSPHKSANRLIEAVMSGKYVCAEPLPAYEEFADMWVGDIAEGVKQASEEKCLKRVSQCQGYIRVKYSPQAIGQRWFDLLQTL